MSLQKNLPTTIEDGYSERGYLRAVPGLHHDVRFTFRPMTVAQRGRMTTAGAKITDDAKSYRFQAALIVDELKLLLEWDIKDSRGNVLEVNAANLMRQKPRVFFGIVAIITGTEPSDIDDAAPHLENTTDKDLLAYAAGDDSDEGADSKNSETG